jgi:hypothetical protein
MATFTQPIGLTINLANAGFVAGTTSTYTTTVTTAFAINGKFGTTLAAQTNTASPTLDANTGVAFPAITANNCACLVWGTNLAGTIALCQGPSVATAVGVTTTVGAFIAAPQFPPFRKTSARWRTRSCVFRPRVRASLPVSLTGLRPASLAP